MSKWGKATERVALRRVYEIAGEVAETHGDDLARRVAESALWTAASEAHFRDGLAEAELDRARIEQEVNCCRAQSSGATLTLTMPASGAVVVTARVNRDAPKEPKRDARGRFRKRLGIVAMVGGGGVEWEVRHDR